MRTLFAFCLCLTIVFLNAHASDSLPEKKVSLFSRVDQGENYLANGQFELALGSLQESYVLVNQLGYRYIEPRILLDMMFAYAYLGYEEEALSAAQAFETSVEDIDCGEYYIYQCKDENYVSGPDREPYDGWCEETVNSTAGTLSTLVHASRLSNGKKFAICSAIDQARIVCLGCCAKGGLWKGCVGPLCRKLVEWKALGVPADPLWD